LNAEEGERIGAEFEQHIAEAGKGAQDLMSLPTVERIEEESELELDSQHRSLHVDRLLARLMDQGQTDECSNERSHNVIECEHHRNESEKYIDLVVDGSQTCLVLHSLRMEEAIDQKGLVVGQHAALDKITEVRLREHSVWVLRWVH